MQQLAPPHLPAYTQHCIIGVGLTYLPTMVSYFTLPLHVGLEDNLVGIWLFCSDSVDKQLHIVHMPCMYTVVTHHPFFIQSFQRLIIVVVFGVTPIALVASYEVLPIPPAYLSQQIYVYYSLLLVYCEVD
ncbi:hypothetical protein J3R30DRAFT_2598153 [Lentinula aciculospora]|uniref:Uncharacterized protein n=1 Tax=Lentinula aciculospora TaxID=153920 RepID=A0A9W9AEN9_9AGAR|nr:hypothetical protein J3R30DRAFT_2598153 [Lentinula aciculospora]